MTQNGEKPDREQHNGAQPEAEAEEVEAEIVDDDIAAAAVFDEDAPEVDEALAGAEDALASKKSTLTPGVLVFFAFTAFALAAFAVWRFQSGDERGQNAPIELSADDVAGETTSDDDAIVEFGVSTSPQEEQPGVPEPGQLAAEKIENTRVEDLRLPTDTPLEGAGALPEPTQSGMDKVANSIEAGAIAAMANTASPDGGPEEGNVGAGENQQTEQELEPDVADEPSMLGEASEGLEVVTENEASPTKEPLGEVSIIDGALEERPIDVAVALDAPDAEPLTQSDPELVAKVTNDIEALKGETLRLAEALATERDRNALLAEEINQMRQSFEAALVERDARYADDLNRVRASLERVENSDIKNASDQLRANLALGALRRKVESGAPFADELAVISQYAPSQASGLVANAHSGVATKNDLRDAFGEAARVGLAAAGQENAGGGVGGLMARAQSLISVRPASPQAGDAPRAIVSRAEAAVSDGDFTMALQELRTMPLSAQQAMAGWTSEAEKHAQAMSALEAMTEQLNTSGSE